MNDVSGLLRDARQRAGLTQREVAERAGVRQPVVAAYEAGRRQPTVATLRKLLRATGHDLEVRITPAHRMPDPRRASKRLGMVLELASHLPRRRRGRRLAYPRLPAA